MIDHASCSNSNAIKKTHASQGTAKETNKIVGLRQTANDVRLINNAVIKTKPADPEISNGRLMLIGTARHVRVKRDWMPIVRLSRNHNVMRLGEPNFSRASKTKLVEPEISSAKQMPTAAPANRVHVRPNRTPPARLNKNLSKTQPGEPSRRRVSKTKLAEPGSSSARLKPIVPAKLNRRPNVTRLSELSGRKASRKQHDVPRRRNS